MGSETRQGELDTSWMTEPSSALGNRYGAAMLILVQALFEP